MEIKLEKVGKRFQFDWIFRHLSYHFKSNQSYAILGANGSGKSTLMKVLAGHLTPTKGEIQFLQAGKTLSKDDVYREVSYAAPYIELIEEFTLMEQIAFHKRFQPLQADLEIKELLEIVQLAHAKRKEIRFFSSGMKQRLKLALACCSDTSILLLDEPTTNLDKQGMQWYLDLIERFGKNRLVIVASNVPIDYQFCTAQLDILDYKSK